MLVLSRKSGESIQIFDNVEITILRTSDRRVQLGINAPAHVPVHRREVWSRIQEEHRDFEPPFAEISPPTPPMDLESDARTVS